MPKIIYNPLTSDFDYINKSTDFKGNFRPSSGTWHYVSGQIFSGGAYYTAKPPASDYYLANKKYVDETVTAGGGFVAANYITSSNSIIRFADSSNIRFRFKGSSSSKSGYSTISNGYGEIIHTLGETPKHINITPSGGLYNFGSSCKVDASKIYVYLTAPGNRNVYWYAST